MIRALVCGLLLTGTASAQVLGGSAVNATGRSNVRLSAPSFSATAASGVNGLACLTNGCRIDFGAGASDYAYSDGTSIVTAGGLYVTAAASVGTALTMVAATSVETCQASIEGRIRRVAGGTSGARTRLCLCTSDGAGTPAYAWQAIPSGTVGSATTCNP